MISFLLLVPLFFAMISLVSVLLMYLSKKIRTMTNISERAILELKILLAPFVPYRRSSGVTNNLSKVFITKMAMIARMKVVVP